MLSGTPKGEPSVNTVGDTIPAVTVYLVTMKSMRALVTCSVLS